MVSFDVGFYIVIVFAALKLGFLGYDLCIVNKTNVSKNNPITVLSIISLVLLITLGGIAFLGLRVKPSGGEGRCTDADADIVGDGVRIGTWILVGVPFFTALVGVFLRETATKELGAGLLVTHVSLALALVVPLARRELPPIDAILGSLILDAQGSALAIQLTAKETLASRWQSVLTPIAQVLGYSIEGILVTWFSNDWLTKNDKCSCFSVFWWSWFSNCSNITPNTAIPFWIYFGLRGVNMVHDALLALAQIRRYDASKKWEKMNSCAPCAVRRVFWCRRCNGVDCNIGGHAQVGFDDPEAQCGVCEKCKTCSRLFKTDDKYLVDGLKYTERFMTTNTTFFENSALSVLALVSAETTIKANSVQLTSRIYSVGQVTALVIAVGTRTRALWVVLYQFVDPNWFSAPAPPAPPPAPAPSPAHQPPPAPAPPAHQPPPPDPPAERE